MSDDGMETWFRLAELNILIGAHDLWIRDSLIHYFESNGCDTTAFDNGKEAIIELSDRSFDIIICDYKLSDMNGIEFFKQIQLLCPRSMKILITAGGNVAIYTHAKNMGLEIIEKPFTTDTIDEAFLQFLDEQDNFTNDL